MKFIAAVVMMAFAAQASVIHQAPSPAITQYSSLPESKLVEVSPAVTTVEAAPVVYQEAAPAVVEVKSVKPAQVGVYADHTAPETKFVEVKSAPIAYAAPAAPIVVKSAPAPIVYSAPQPQLVEYRSAPAPIVYSAPAPQLVEYRSAPAPIVYSAPAPQVVEVKSTPQLIAVKSAPQPIVYQAAAPTFVKTVEAAPIVLKSVEAAPVIVKQTPAVVAAIPGEAKYTAVNRGALHEAPLPGHALSQTSVNLAEAS